MTEDQFALLLRTVLERTRGAGDGGGSRKVSLKAFTRMTKFSKGEEDFKDWNFDFAVALGSECPELLQNLKVIETMPEEMTTRSVYDLDVDRADRMGLDKLSKELYEVLVMVTEGEAKMMIRSVPDQDGILAWHRLYRHYNRKTLARVLRIHREAMHPKPSSDIGNLISNIVEWEDKWTRMAKEYPSVPILWKMAALMELCPADVQDMVYQTIDDVHEDYERLKQKILSWVSNKMSTRNGPVPMDIGRVDGGDSTFEFGVDAIGNNSQCYNCGGWGHASRECPSDRGAKGGKAKGKVKGLDKGVGKGGKGGGDGGTKGKGKGYQGTCYTCGKVGHKAWECRARNVNAVQEESGGETEDVVDVGTIWNVGHVETVDVMAVVGGEPPTNKFQITLDSGAGASCWPAEWMPDVPMKPKQPGVKFRAANGDELEYFGRKDIGFCPLDGNGKCGKCSMEFHVTNATKPLASAMAVVKAGNKVVLSHEMGGSYIENIATGKRIKLKESGGTFVFEVEADAGNEASHEHTPVFSRRE